MPTTYRVIDEAPKSSGTTYRVLGPDEPVPPAVQDVGARDPYEMAIEAVRPLGTRKGLEEAAPTAATIALSLMLGPEAGLITRLLTAGAAGAGSRGVVEAERGITGSPEAARTSGEAAKRIGGEALKQTLFQGAGELIGLPFKGGGAQLAAESEFPTKMLGRPISRRNVADFALEQRLGITAPESTQAGGIWSQVQHLAETSLFGARTARESGEMGHTSSQDIIENFRRTFGPKMTDQEVGETIQTHIPEVKEAVSKRFGKLYDSVFGGQAMTVDMTPAKAEAKLLADNLRKSISRSPGTADRNMAAFERAQNFLRTSADLSPREAHEARSLLWELARDPNTLPKERMVASRLASEIDGSLEKLGPEWRGINAEYKEWNKVLAKSAADKLTKQQESNVGSFIYRSGDTRIKSLTSLFEKWGKVPEAKQAIQQGFANELFKDSDAAGLVNEKLIYNTLSKVGPEKLKVVFGGDAVGQKALEDLVLLAQAQRQMPRMFNPSGTAVGLRAHSALRQVLEFSVPGIGAAVGSAHGPGGAIAGMMTGGMATLTFEGLLSRIIFNEGATKSLVRAMEMANTGNLQAASANVLRAIALVQPSIEVGKAVMQKLSSQRPSSPQPSPTPLPTTIVPTPSPVTTVQGAQ